MAEQFCMNFHRVECCDFFFGGGAGSVFSSE